MNFQKTVCPIVAAICLYNFLLPVNALDGVAVDLKKTQVTMDTKGFAKAMHREIEKRQANDPSTGRRINTLSDITLREVLQKFLKMKPIRKDTQQNYHYAIRAVSR
jgi:hypothetical protein